MAQNLNNISTCEMTPGISTTVAWKLTNWNEYSELLVPTASCVVELDAIGDEDVSEKILLRFKLKKIVESEDNAFSDKPKTTNIFYGLNLRILNDDDVEKPISFKVRAQDTANRLDTGEVSLTFWDKKEMTVDKYFIYDSYQEKDSRGLRIVGTSQNFFGTTVLDEDVEELNIKISVTLFTLKREEEGNLSLVENSALVTPKPQKLDEFGVFLEDNHFWDVKLRMKDEVLVPAHRIILASRSSVFRAMLTSDMKESKEEIIEIPDIGSEAMKIILRYIYTGEVELDLNGDKDGERMKQVVYGASKYNLPQLLQYCDKMLTKVVNFGNAWELLKLAKMHNMPEAMEDLKKFVKKNCFEILEQTVGDN